MSNEHLSPSEPDAVSRFRKILVDTNATADVKESYEKLIIALKRLDTAVFPYFVDRPELRYSAVGVPRTKRGYHPFVHISPGKAQLEVHLKDVEDPNYEITKRRSPSGKKYANSFPRKIAIRSPGEINEKLIEKLRQSLWIMRKHFSES